MCERKPSGKVHVSPEIAQQHKEGGSAREALEMALLEAIARHGVDRRNYRKIKAGMIMHARKLKSLMCIFYIYRFNT